MARSDDVINDVEGDVDVDMVVMTSKGNPATHEAHRSTRRNFGRRVRAHGSSDVEVSGSVE